MRYSFGAILLLIAVTALGSGYYLLQPTPPQNDDYEFVLVSDELVLPVYATHAGDDRLFVVEKEGRIRFIREGELQSAETPFLDIQDRVGASGNEQGLLSMAFSPDYTDSGSFYVYYTDKNGDTVVSRFWVSADNPDQADATTEEVILTQPQPYQNHNGGQLQFGPDGYLYIGLGDGGSAGDPQNNGQNLETWLGKILRVDVSDTSYSVPADNPFMEDEAALPEIWAYGLRNPWRFSFDRETGDLYIADVGQSAIEEINFQPAGDVGGQNYGWRFYEGSEVFTGRGDANVLTFPVAEYDHGDGHCSVTGGYVYRGEALSDLQGQYIFGDFCSGVIWTLPAGDGGELSEFMDSDLNITSFGENAEGELFITSYPGELWMLVAREG